MHSLMEISTNIWRELNRGKFAFAVTAAKEQRPTGKCTSWPSASLTLREVRCENPSPIRVSYCSYSSFTWARQLIYSAVRRSSVESVDNSEICYICFIIAPQTRQLKPQLEVDVEVDGGPSRRSEAIFVIIIIISTSWRAPHTCAHIKKQVSQVFKSV